MLQSFACTILSVLLLCAAVNILCICCNLGIHYPLSTFAVGYVPVPVRRCCGSVIDFDWPPGSVSLLFIKFQRNLRENVKYFIIFKDFLLFFNGLKNVQVGSGAGFVIQDYGSPDSKEIFTVLICSWCCKYVTILLKHKTGRWTQETDSTRLFHSVRPYLTCFLIWLHVCYLI